MKRSEVIRRLRGPLNAAVGVSRANGVNYASESANLIEEGCILAIAHALGIEVEPDKPDTLTISREPAGMLWTIKVRGDISGSQQVIGGRTDRECLQLEAAFAAYNESLRTTKR